MKTNTPITGLQSPIPFEKKPACCFPLANRPRKKGAGFTLPEMLIALGLFSLLIIGLVSSQIYAMRVYTLAATKLTATANARFMMDQIRDQIRGAYEVDIGNCRSNWVSFAYITNGPQQGNAVEIFPTTNSTPFLICYLQTNTAETNQLMLYNSSLGTARQLATYVTNQIIFDAEDVWGNVLTNNLNNRVVRMTLRFSQWEYPMVRVGSTNFNAFDFYQLRTCVTRRAID